MPLTKVDIISLCSQKSSDYVRMTHFLFVYSRIYVSWLTSSVLVLFISVLSPCDIIIFMWFSVVRLFFPMGFFHFYFMMLIYNLSPYILKCSYADASGAGKDVYEFVSLITDSSYKIIRLPFFFFFPFCLSNFLCFL